MRREGGILGVPLLLAVALAAILITVLDPPEGRPAVAAAPPSADVVQEPVADVVPAGNEEELLPPVQDPASRTAAPPEHRIRAALAELTPMLDAPELARTRWELTGRALAKFVGVQSGPELLELVSKRETPAPERVAAAELLRRVHPQAEVPEWALGALRQAAFGGLPEAAQASAARRVLAGLGDWSDRLRLVGELELAPSDEVAIAASWSLRAARSHDVLPDLRRLIQSTTEDRTAELTLLSMESIVRATGPMKPDLRDAMTEAVVSAVAFRPEHATRAAGLLGVLGGPEAEHTLTELARSEVGCDPAAQALAETAGGRNTLSGLLSGGSINESSRLAAATALARGAESSDDHRRAALAGLRLLAREGNRPGHRRRAVLALAEYAPDAALALEATLLEDPDASVRATAVLASARLDEPGAVRAALSACLTADPSPGVRELAERALAE